MYKVYITINKGYFWQLGVHTYETKPDIKDAYQAVFNGKITSTPDLHLCTLLAEVRSIDELISIFPELFI